VLDSRPDIRRESNIFAPGSAGEKKTPKYARYFTEGALSRPSNQPNTHKKQTSKSIQAKLKGSCF
jgi:hypothetical protein